MMHRSTGPVILKKVKGLTPRILKRSDLMRPMYLNTSSTPIHSQPLQTDRRLTWFSKPMKDSNILSMLVLVVKSLP